MKKGKLKNLQFNKAVISKITMANIFKIHGGDEGIRRTIIAYRCQQD